MEETDTKPKEETKAFACEKCGKSFDRRVQLSMHRMRMHTRAGLRGAMWKSGGVRPTKLSRSQALARRRAQQRQQRAEFHARGLTSRGLPRKSPLPRQFTDPKEARRAYRREWYHKHKNKANKRIQIVYPPPGTQPEAEEQKIKYCPYCKGDIGMLMK